MSKPSSAFRNVIHYISTGQNRTLTIFDAKMAEMSITIEGATVWTL